MAARRRLIVAALAAVPAVARAGDDYGFVITWPFFAGVAGGLVYGYLQGSRGLPGALGVVGAIAIAFAIDLFLNFSGPPQPGVFVPLFTTTFMFFGGIPFLLMQWLGYKMARRDRATKPEDPQ